MTALICPSLHPGTGDCLLENWKVTLDRYCSRTVVAVAVEVAVLWGPGWVAETEVVQTVKDLDWVERWDWVLVRLPGAGLAAAVGSVCLQGTTYGLLFVGLLEPLG